jgi:hypothetical protein
MGFLVLLGSVLLIAFFRFMDRLNKVPPESTQITLVNATNQRVQIDRFVFGEEVILDNDGSYLDKRKPDSYTWYLYSFYIDQPDMETNISVTYTGMKSRETWQAQGIALRVLDRPCRFVVLLRPGGGEVSSCMYNELQDFEHD